MKKNRVFVVGTEKRLKNASKLGRGKMIIRRSHTGRIETRKRM